jgi:hypothetical protein
VPSAAVMPEPPVPTTVSSYSRCNGRKGRPWGCGVSVTVFCAGSYTAEAIATGTRRRPLDHQGEGPPVVGLHDRGLGPRIPAESREAAHRPSHHEVPRYPIEHDLLQTVAEQPARPRTDEEVCDQEDQNNRHGREQVLDQDPEQAILRQQPGDRLGDAAKHLVALARQYGNEHDGDEEQYAPHERYQKESAEATHGRMSLRLGLERRSP